MRPLISALLYLALLDPFAQAQDAASIISLLLGNTIVAAPIGVDRTSFSVCTEVVSSEATLATLEAGTSSLAIKKALEIAVDVMCNEGVCASVGQSRFDSCCSVVSEEDTATDTAVTYALDCFSKFQGAAKTGPTSASATTTGGTASSGSAASSSAASSSGGGGGLSLSGSSSSTSAPSSGSSPSPSPSSSSNSGGTPRNTDLFAGSVLALFIGLVGYIL